MVERTNEGDQFNWQLLLYAVLSTFVVFVSLAIWTSERIFYLLVVAPIISTFLLIYAKLKKGRERLSILSMLVMYWAVSAALIPNYFAVRETSRWLLWSRDYKAEVLTQKGLVNGELKHIEWDGWGVPGAGDTNVYLVFDPEDSLLAAVRSHQHGKFSGIPCEVDLVRRLESHWYSVRLYTDEFWDRRNTAAC